MSPTGVAVLGATAGFTIFPGLPVALLPKLSVTARAALNAGAAGVLLFLLWDVLSHAAEPVEGALGHATEGTGSWWRFAGLAAGPAGGVAARLVALCPYGRRAAARPSARPLGPAARRAHA